MPAEYDDSASIGKRYRRQDEIGTPWALTIDHQTLEDDTVTIRDRDTLAQERIPIAGARAAAARPPRRAPWQPRARRDGRWHELAVESAALRGNPLGDPATRPLFVWTPPSYDADAGRRFPVVYVLQGLTGQARAWFNVSPFAKNFPELVDEAGARG